MFILQQHNTTVPWFYSLTVLFTEGCACSNTTLLYHVLFTESSPCNNPTLNAPWFYSLRVHLAATQHLSCDGVIHWDFILQQHNTYCAMVLFTESSYCNNTTVPWCYSLKVHLATTLMYHGVIHWEFILQQHNATVPWCYSLRVHLAATQHYCALVLFTKSSSCNNQTLLYQDVIHWAFILQQHNALKVHLAS